MEQVCGAGCSNGNHDHEHHVQDDRDHNRSEEEEGSPVMSEEEFSKIVGLVEDIFVSEAFQTKHTDYFTQHCQLFSDDMEGGKPLSSMEFEQLTKEKFNVFRTYSVEMAVFLETELKKNMGDQFEIDGFIQEIERRTQRAEAIAQERAASGGESPSDGSPRGGNSPRKDTNNETTTLELIGLDSEIFETLLTLKDYARFQELMVDFLKMKQGKMPDMEGLVSLRKISDDEAESV